MTPPPTPREVLLANLDLVSDIVRVHARRLDLPPQEREELEGWVRLKLVEDDFAVLRRFAGRSTLRTYLTTVVQRLLLDLAGRDRGRWRASAAARRLGALGEALEDLLHRRGVSFDEACRSLQAMPAWRHVTVRELAELQRCLPPRLPAPRGAVSGEKAEAWARDRRPDPEQATVASEMARTVGGALAAAFRRQQARDRLILRLRFEQGLTGAEIGAAVGLAAKAVYRRIDQLLHDLQGEMRAAGIRSADVADLLARAPDVEPAEAIFEENPPSRPSNSADEGDAEDLDAR